jgi:hypothetical protein
MTMIRQRINPDPSVVAGELEREMAEATSAVRRRLPSDGSLPAAPRSPDEYGQSPARIERIAAEAAASVFPSIDPDAAAASLRKMAGPYTIGTIMMQLDIDQWLEIATHLQPLLSDERCKTSEGLVFVLRDLAKLLTPPNPI